MYKFVLFVVPVALFAASGSDKSTAAQPPQKAAQSAAKSGSTSIPPDAVEIGPQAYRYKDADGKVWIYRRTPFGISKVEERAVDQATPAKPQAKVLAFDKGDSVRFEQQTPMGPRVWERKKSELTAQEKVWLDETRTAGATESAKPEK